MKDYARALIKRFDTDNDGVITFQELCEGLKQFDIDLPLNQRIGLMKKLDVDKDGEITDIELTRALKTVEDEMIHDAVETAIKKIASGADDHTSMREYVKVLFKKFDLNNDGLISLQELSDGLKRIQIYLSSRER
jgi:Ca2+-binding EF-hand superfamily protein